MFEFCSSRAEEVQAGTFLAESYFCIIISLTGLVLLAMIIGTIEVSFYLIVLYFCKHD